MRRREFIAAFGGAAAWPVAARAQQKLPTIGLLGTVTPAAWGTWTPAFVQRLRELGWVDGRTIIIEARWGEGRLDRYNEIAAEFIKLKVEAIITAGAAVPVLKQATSTIPIVFAVDGDPVGSGLVASLARPGGNVTGLSTQATDLGSKRLELLREVLPSFQRLAVLLNVTFSNAVMEFVEVQAAAKALGIDIVDKIEIRKAQDIGTAFGKLTSEAQALYVCSDPVAASIHTTINTLAMGARLPTISANRTYLPGGGFISYGVNNADLFRRAADYIDKILRGAKPADLPVEQATKFELVINLTTAKALGLKIPESFVLRADEVIE